ncbi:hypothetical protein LUZ60_016344 [Juncus effusus]|nr:hypothetical protein LUZ60_016344 [Juncus effusus]
MSLPLYCESPNRASTHLLPKSTKDSPPLSPTRPTNQSSQILRRTTIVLFFLAIQVVLFLHVRPIKLFSHREPSACKSGLVYVYDLPPQFNIDLIKACDSLFPWASFCPSFSNSGFGPASSSDPEFSALVPSPVLQSWFSTNQFSLELIFHQRMLNHQCRTLNPSQASAFYVPFYAGLAVGRNLWSPNSTASDRDKDCSLLLQWLKKQEPFQKSHGWDHFIAFGRITWDFRRSSDPDWGSSFLYMPEMKNVTRLSVERSPWDEMDVAVPYPTSFHPKSLADIQQWQNFVLNHKRSTIFGFAGAPRAEFKNDFRGLLLDECIKAGNKCRSVDCTSGKCEKSGARTMELFLDSEFCLQPRGDSFTRRSMFDCMLAGSMPVLFWKRSAYLQYKWFLPTHGKELDWSVFIDRRDLRGGNVSISAVLEEIGKEKAREMRERVVEMIPKLIYSAEAHGDDIKDAFDVALQGVFQRFKEHRWRLQLGISS